MLTGIGVWIVRVTLVLSVLAALLPCLAVGNWIVRLCDFPRIQLAVCAAVPLGIAIAQLVLNSWRVEHLVSASIAVIVIAWQLAHVTPYTPLWSTDVPSHTGNDDSVLRIVVANIQVDNQMRSELLATLQSCNADVLLLIEVDESWESALQPLRQTFTYTCEEVRHKGLGMVLWSRIPFSRAEVKYLVSERRPSIHAELLLPTGERIQFVGLHPTPPGLLDSTIGGRRDSRVRDAELVRVARSVSKRPDESWIVTGDFNDVAWSYTTRLFKRLSGLEDPRVGRKLLNTYHADHPLFRYPIDHVFLSDDCRIRELSRLRLPGSDHFAVVAEMSLAKPRRDSGPEADQEDNVDAVEIIEEGEQDAVERGVETG